MLGHGPGVLVELEEGETRARTQPQGLACQEGLLLGPEPTAGAAAAYTTSSTQRGRTGLRGPEGRAGIGQHARRGSL